MYELLVMKNVTYNLT